MADWFYNHGLTTGNNDGSTWENAFQSAYTVPGTLASGDDLHFKEHTGIDGSSNALTFSIACTLHGGYTSTLTGTTTGSAYQTGITVLNGSDSGTNRALVFTADMSVNHFEIEEYTYTTAPILSMSDVDVTFEDCVFHDCVSTGSDDTSGILVAFGSGASTGLTLTACEFYNFSGATFGPIRTEYHYLDIDDCYFHSCTSEVYGGAIAISAGSEVHSINTTVFDQCSSTFGGAVRVEGGDNVSITRSLIDTCTAIYAAGIYTEGSTLLIRNSQFVDCTSDYSGVINTNASSTLSVVNSTLANNTATYTVCGGIETGADPYIANCILWGNTGTTGSGSQVLSSGSAGALIYSDVDDLSGDGVSGITTITSCVDVNPQFAGSGADPYALTSSTPSSVSQGASTGVTGYVDYDYLDADRDNSTPSMGCYEYVSAGWTSISAVDGISQANISGVDGISKANISTIDGKAI